MLLRRARGSGGEGGSNREKEGRRDGDDTARGNWKFLLPFRFTPNHATVVGFIQRILMRFATETSLRVDTLNDTERWKVTIAS